MRLNPSSHMYVAMAPKVDMLTFTDPLVGFVNEPQLTTEDKRNSSLITTAWYIGMATYSHTLARFHSKFH